MLLHSELGSAIRSHMASLRNNSLSHDARQTIKSRISTLVKGRHALIAVMGTREDHVAYERSIGEISGMPDQGYYLVSGG